MIHHHCCFVWFGGIHAFLALIAARLLGKQLFIVAGGYDAVYLPDYKYGIRAEKKSGWRRTYFAFRHANRVLAVSKSIAESLGNECKAKNNVSLVYNGIDPALFSIGKNKEALILTVGHVSQRNLIMWNRLYENT